MKKRWNIETTYIYFYDRSKKQPSVLNLGDRPESLRYIVCNTWQDEGDLKQYLISQIRVYYAF